MTKGETSWDYVPDPVKCELLTSHLFFFAMTKFDDIWFTYKARIAAENRLRNNDLHSQLQIAWSAVLTTAGSTIAMRYEKFLGPNTDIMMAVLSVALLASGLADEEIILRFNRVISHATYKLQQDVSKLS